MRETTELTWAETWQLTTSATPASLSVLLEAQRQGLLETVLGLASRRTADPDEAITLARYKVRYRRPQSEGGLWG